MVLFVGVDSLKSGMEIDNWSVSVFQWIPKAFKPSSRSPGMDITVPSLCIPPELLIEILLSLISTS